MPSAEAGYSSSTIGPVLYRARSAYASGVPVRPIERAGTGTLGLTGQGPAEWRLVLLLPRPAAMDALSAVLSATR
jgi:hypothetical protein